MAHTFPGPFQFVLLLQVDIKVHIMVGTCVTGKPKKTASKQKQTTERPESYTPCGYAPVTQTPPLKDYIASQRI